MRRGLVALGLVVGVASAGRAQQVTNPHGPLAVTCATCHAPDAWKPVRIATTFKHAPETFPLEGAHVRTTCTGCHKQLDFKGVSPKCASCHEDVHKGELGADCARCHTPRSFAEEPAMKQAHELTRFPLRGAHASADCSACHTPSSSGRLQFVAKSTTCAGCHASDAKAVTFPDHQAAGFSRECTACHSINTWKNPRFDHGQTAFPLVGAHQAATCEGCHADKVYKGKDTRCVSCHLADYNQAAAPRHADGFPTTCTDCHGSTAWKGASFDHASSTRFPLTGAHQATTCAGCHADGVFKGKALECASCHQADYQSTTRPAHGPAGFGTTCTACHTTTAWLGQPFDHGMTRFALTGAHRAVSCTSCHADNVYRGRSMECASCHQTDFQATTNPPHAAAGFTAPCTSCHTTTAWAGATFNHDATRFALTGTHRTTTCAGCHADNVYRGKPTTCVSCHRPDYDASQAPPHAGFPVACESCHATTTWTGATFDHAQTDFPLTGTHRTTSCSGCHSDGVFNGKPADCASCHRARYDATTNPPHAAAGYGTNCTTCHNTTAWLGTPFNHATTRFPLTGAHTTATCQSCHADGVYRGKPMDCFSCHKPSYDATRTPPHGPSSIGTTCTSCHTTATWVGGTYDHSVTSFPLTGAHRASTCAGCHADGVYNNKPTDCFACHRPDYDATANPPHASAGYGTTCATCHNTNAWLGTPFNHSSTQFPLTGAHTTATCQSCHADGIYKGKPTDCVSCHRTSYDATLQPPHGGSGIGTTCTNCHTTATWVGGTYDHSVTSFPLTGAHRAASCAGCHADGVYRGKPASCVSCHRTEYDGTTNPSHVASSFPTTCTTCHTTTAWAGAVFDHGTTAFPLTGAHRAATCSNCHGDGVYQGKSTACQSCHQTEYAATTQPPHAASGIGTTCTSCHTTTAWAGGTYNHSTTAFPLTGAHTAVTCAGCHSDGVYRGKSMACASCHQTDYNQTTNPNHAAASFPTTCSSCHSTATWIGATFNHDAQWFPIYSGKHRGKWSTCATCHTSPTNFQVFTCLSCHEHRQTEMDDKHRGRSGYKYDSQSCYACHPRGTD